MRRRQWMTMTGLGLLAAGRAQAEPLTVQLVDAGGVPLAGAVLALEQPGLPRRARAGAIAEMAQRDRQFNPRLLVVQTGSEVRFPNEDPVRHHVYSYSPAKTFELKLYLGETAPPQRFDKAGVVQLGCNIHDQMSAFIVVVDTPVFGITNTQGELKLERLPGAGTLRAWHPKLSKPELQTLELQPGAVMRWVMR
jgi:plastocyanin